MKISLQEAGCVSFGGWKYIEIDTLLRAAELKNNNGNNKLIPNAVKSPHFKSGSRLGFEPGLA